MMTNTKPNSSLLTLSKVLIYVGNMLTILGCLGVLLGLVGAYDFNIFAFGLSSGVRMVGSVAIAGCLLSAIGYGMSDFFIN